MSGLIRVEGVSVSFGATRALAGVSFSCNAGVTGLLGPNGAGKTTLLSVLSRGRRPDSGRVEVDPSARQDLARHGDEAIVGYLPERFDLAGGMRVVDIVRYAAWCNGVARHQLVSAADAALEMVELDVRRRDRARVLSGGQRQRLGLAAAIAHDPDVLLLDEPTAGLDPEQRVNFRGYLHAISDSVAVVLATHLLDDVQQTAQDLLVLSGGRIAFSGKPDELAATGRDQPGGLASDLESGYRAVITQEGTEGSQ